MKLGERNPELVERNRWICEQRQSGRKLADIGRDVGLSRERVRSIVWKAQYAEASRCRLVARLVARGLIEPTNKGRPIDMGGPRDVWLTFFPPPDPRLDNMEPVSP